MLYELNAHIAYGGAIYQKAVDGSYRRLECYLPSAEGTYGEPIATTFYRLVIRIEKGLLVPSFADGLRYERAGDKMRPLPRSKKAPAP